MRHGTEVQETALFANKMCFLEVVAHVSLGLIYTEHLL